MLLVFTKGCLQIKRVYARWTNYLSFTQPNSFNSEVTELEHKMMMSF